MNWARMFACVDSSSVPRQDKFLKLDSKDAEFLVGELKNLITRYTGSSNPEPEPVENKAAHYIKRLNPRAKQKFFCGQKGRLRAKRFDDILDAKNIPDIQKLKTISQSAFYEYKAAWFNSYLAESILIAISVYADEKNYKNADFLQRIQDKLMTESEEKAIEMVSYQEMKKKL